MTDEEFRDQVDTQTAAMLRMHVAQGGDPKVLVAVAAMPTVGLNLRLEACSLAHSPGVPARTLAHVLAIVWTSVGADAHWDLARIVRRSLPTLMSDPALRDMVDAALAYLNVARIDDLAQHEMVILADQLLPGALEEEARTSLHSGPVGRGASEASPEATTLRVARVPGLREP